MTEQNSRSAPQETPEERFAALVERFKQKNDPDTAYQLALCYRDGTGTEKSEFSYLRLLIRAERLGNSDAAADMCRVGADRFLGYAQVLQQKERYADAFLFFQTAGRLGLSQGWYGAGSMLQSGQGVKQDLGKAALCYRKGAESGDGVCMMCLALLYARGEGVEKNLEQALALEKKAKESGMLSADVPIDDLIRETEQRIEKRTRAYIVGRVDLEAGKHEEAARLFRFAAEEGDADAAWDMSVMYNRGDGVPKDEKEAFRWRLRAAELGSAMATWAVSTSYYVGDGVPQDEKESFRWRLRAAELGYAEAMYHVAAHLYTGKYGAEKDCEQGLFWAQKALASGEEMLAKMKADNVFNAIVGLANDAGWEALQAGDMAAAARQLRFAAEQGHPNAAWNLGLMYRNGDGVTKDEKEGFRWRVRAAELGHANAMYDVARDYMNGWCGAEKDYDQARFWAQKAKESGELPADKSADDLLRTIENNVTRDAIDAAYKAGANAYKAGNYAEAFRQYQFIAEKGNSSGLFVEDKLVNVEDRDDPLVIRMGGTSEYIRNANYNLGLMYFHGQGVSVNKAKAATYYETAAKQGDDDAQLIVGLMYYEGNGVNKDYKKAAEYLKMAARKGNAAAKFNLGCFYYDGIGVPRDRAKARELLQKAAAKGNEDAKRALKKYF